MNHIPPQFSDFKIIKYLDRINDVLKGEFTWPVTVELDPTNQCNHNCLWCIDQRLHQNEGQRLSKRILDQLVGEFAEVGVASVTVKGGGEPLMHRHIDVLLQNLKQNGVRSGLITNGQLLPEHLPSVASSCDWVRVSLDAAQAGTHAKVHRPSKDGAFVRIEQGIAGLPPEVFTGVNMVVHPLNMNEILELGVKAKAWGAKYAAYKKVILPNNPFSEQELQAMYQAYAMTRNQLEDDNFWVLGSKMYNFNHNHNVKPYGICLAHHLVGIVCADAKVYACCSTRGNPDYCFGSLESNSFVEIWQSPQRREVLKKIEQGQCRRLCIGKTSHLRYDHYNAVFEYLSLSDPEHADFL